MHTEFGLKWRESDPLPSSKENLDFWEAVHNNKIKIKSVKGKCLGKDALKVNIASNSSSALTIELRRGTIFEHIDWVHKQNLCVSNRTVLSIEAFDECTFKTNA